MQFLLWLFLELHQVTFSMIDSAKKKEVFGLQLVKILDEFTRGSYLNKKGIASLLTKAIPFDGKLMTSSLVDKSILSLLFKTSKYK